MTSGGVALGFAMAASYHIRRPANQSAGLKVRSGDLVK
jgi:hypothetical protein